MLAQVSPLPLPLPPSVRPERHLRVVPHLRLVVDNTVKPPSPKPSIPPWGWLQSFLWFVWLEFEYPATLADGTLAGKPVRPLTEAPIGTNPVPELDSQVIVPSPIDGTWQYRNLVTISVVDTLFIESLENPPIFESYYIINTEMEYKLYDRAYSVDYEVLTGSATFVRGPDQVDNWSRPTVFEIKEFNTLQGWELLDNTQPPSSRNHGTQWRPDLPGNERLTTFVNVVDTTYKPADAFPSPETAPGPITPQPQPQPETVPIPQPREPLRMVQVGPDAVLAPVTVPQTLVEPQTMPAPQVVPQPISPDAVPVVVPSPTPIVQPEIVPIAPIEVQEIDFDGLPIPLPGTITKVTELKEHFPWPGKEGVLPGGVPATLKGIADEVGRIEQKTGLIGAAVDALGGLGGGGDLEVDGTTYTLAGVCETPDDSGNQPVFSTPIGKQAYPDAVIARLDAMQYLLQAHLGYKTPICGQSPTYEKPKLEGTWISTRWVSDGDSPGGAKRLRKLFRYRSKSTRSADELRSYWSGIAWEAGPVIVQHKGAWWGTPQVWAATEEEGKRVIRFAAGEAGIDPDLDGEWIVGSSSSSRYGMSGKMRLEKPRGEYWVTRRDGPNGPPQ